MKYGKYILGGVVVLVGARIVAPVIAQIAVYAGIEAAQPIADFLYLPNDPVQRACALAMREYNKTDKTSTAYIDEASNRPDNLPIGCTVGPMQAAAN